MGIASGRRGLCGYVGLALCALFLCPPGCASPVEVARQDRATVVAGQSQAEVEARLGVPARVIGDQAGGAMWVYEYERSPAVVATAIVPMVLLDTLIIVTNVVTFLPFNFALIIADVFTPRGVHIPVYEGISLVGLPGDPGSFRLHFDAEGRVDWVAPVELRRRIRVPDDRTDIVLTRKKDLYPGLTKENVRGYLGGPPDRAIRSESGEMWVYTFGKRRERVSYRIFFGRQGKLEWVSPLE